MELYLKKSKRTVLDKFEITDEKGKVIYDAKGELISSGNRLRLLDTKGKEVAVIHEKKVSLRKKYIIGSKTHGDLEVLRKETLRKVPEFEIRELGWDIKGDFEKNDYKIMKGLKVIAHIKPKKLSFGEMLKIEVSDADNTALALAAVLVCELDQ